jgi:hypothetical protein
MASMKRFFLLLIPPIFINFYLLFIKSLFSSKLFDGDDHFFKYYLAQSKIYFEYGVGSSTKYALLYSSTYVYSVDTSKEWLSKYTELNSNRFIGYWVDLGPLREWGSPIGFSKHFNFDEYVSILWDKCVFKPDLVLIDGRFRVACFLKTILESELGTKIIFDDYVHRPQYHIVEEILKVSQFSKRQALFIVSDFDRIKAENMLEKFKFVIG